VVIPPSVTSIGFMAFSCTALTSIIIPDTVSFIGSSAFMYCSSLTSVTIPSDSVTSIGDHAFCNCLSLTEVHYSGTSDSHPDICTFYDCSDSLVINVPYNYVGDTFRSIIVKKASNPCISTDACGGSVNYLSDMCTGILTISGSGYMTNYSSNTAVPWHSHKDSITSVVIEDGITSIGGNSFNGCSKLTSVIIPHFVTYIGAYAFNGCSILTSLSIPDEVTYIGDCAFNGCSGLTSLSIPDEVTYIGDCAFNGCSGLTGTLIIPDTVTFIGIYAFNSCSGLTKGTYGGTTDPGPSSAAFNGTSIISVHVPCNYNNAGFCGVSIKKGILTGNCGIDVVYALDKCACALTISGSGNMISTPWESYKNIITSAVIESKVVSIGDNAFKDCTSLTSIIISNSVTSIGTSAFNGCTGLTLVTIPNSVISIDWNAFYGCSSLTLVTIPNSVTSIGASAFYGCSGLTSVTISNSVISIDTSAFYGCSGLTSVTIPNSVTSIGASAFDGCSGLTYAIIPDTITSINENTFMNCAKLKEVTIPSSVTSIGTSAFDGCASLTIVTYKGTSDPGSTSANVFRGTQVTKVNVPCEYTNSLFCSNDINKNCCIMELHQQNRKIMTSHLLNLLATPFLLK